MGKGIVVALAVAIAACSAPAPQAPEIDRQAMEAEVTTWLQTFWATWAEGGAGYDRGIAMFDDHADFAFAVDGVLWRSFPAVAEMIRPIFQTIDHQTFDIPVTAVAVLGPDLAHVSLEGTFVQTDVAGDSVGPTPIAATMVLVRTDGAWKVRFMHQSTPNATGSGT